MDDHPAPRGGQNPAYALTRHMGKGGGFGSRLSPAPGSAGWVDVLVKAEQVGGVVGALELDEAGVVRTVGLVHQAGVVGGHVVHVPVLGEVRPWLLHEGLGPGGVSMGGG